jgi:uncharacterized membrane protein
VRKLLTPVVWAIVVLNIGLSAVLVWRIAYSDAAVSSQVVERGDAMANMLALSTLDPEDRQLARSILNARLADHREAVSAVNEANRDVIAAFAVRPFDVARASKASERLLEARLQLSRQATATYVQVFSALPPDAQDKLVEHARERRALIFPAPR